MKRAIYGGVVAMAFVLTASSAQGQYGYTQPSLLPNYPTTYNAYPLNQGMPVYSTGYRQDVAPGSTGGEGAPFQGQPNQAAPLSYSAAGAQAGGPIQHPQSPGFPQTQGHSNAPQQYPNPGPAYHGHPASGPSYGGGRVDIDGSNSGNVYQSVVTPGNFAGGDCGHSSSFAAACEAPRRSNWVFGLRGLTFFRDYEDDVSLSYYPGGTLHSTDADFSYLPGIEGIIGVRTAKGWGWEGRYWGLFPSEADVSFTGAPLYTSLTTLDQLDMGAFTVRGIYDNAVAHRIYRNNEIHNIELNFLRNAGCFNGLFCRSTNIELLAGIRYLRFDESFRYAAFGIGAYPPQVNYDLEVENDLLGFQLGGRTEHCLSERIRLNISTKFGFYNNQIYHRQSITDIFGNYAVVNTGGSTGELHNVVNNKNDVAFLGELDLGLLCQITQRTRFSFGYRAIGIGGVALAPDQIPRNFADSCEACRIDSNGSLILHGAYAGLDFCF